MVAKNKEINKKVNKKMNWQEQLVEIVKLMGYLFYKSSPVSLAFVLLIFIPVIGFIISLFLVIGFFSKKEFETKNDFK